MKKIIALSFISTLLFSSVSLATDVRNPGNGKSSVPTVGTQVRTYKSPQREGRIGITEEIPYDNPSDNIFHVMMDSKPEVTSDVWLVYELNGVYDHNSVSRSVNDQRSVGGYLVKHHEGWVEQREQLSPGWLKRGDNVIRFGAPENVRHFYSIRNLRVEVQQATGSANEVKLVLNQVPARDYYGTTGYVKGFVQGKQVEKAHVKVSGKIVPLFNGEFESFVDLSEGGACATELELIAPDGTTTCHVVTFDHAQSFDFSYGFNATTLSAEKVFAAGSSDQLSLEGAMVSSAKRSLLKASSISITTLRDVDVPALDAGMVNVTANHHGFRFLPHGKVFSSDVQITLPYDVTKIPDGYTEQDIRTYYFDEQAHHWVALPRDTVNATNAHVISRSGHFTDMINGVLKVPEAPLVEAFTSTSMKGIKAANPNAGVNLIQAPGASSGGGAALGYALKIPAGRSGIQPQLNIGYSSSAGNGWLGLGWNLTIPMVSIETRWGVPRYDVARETETYTLNGEMLSPVAHRAEAQARSGGDKQFYPRVEGAFSKIIRHGTNPKNYWWEVIDKNGTKFFYGGTSTGFDKSAVLRDNEKDDEGNIAQWYLAEIRDVNGNNAKYKYIKQEDKGVVNGTVNGYQIYIDKILYTGFGSGEGRYSIVFLRDRQLNEPKRKDVSIVANLGFKQVTADLLRKVEVKFDGKNIRHYELKYKTGEFYKNLLASISEFDSEGKLFNTHEFDYFNDVRKTDVLAPFLKNETWTIPSDGIDGGLIVSKTGFDDNASALSGNKSSDFGFGMTVTVGFNDGQLVNKSNTLGGSFGYSEAETNGKLYMIDINGDGLADKVMADDNGFRYRANISKSGIPRYSDQVYEIRNAGEFFKDKSKTTNFGFEAQGGFGNFSAFVGAGGSKTTSVTSVYFTDVNGDQLPDLIANGMAYFNHLDPATGIVTFHPTSTNTPSPIASGVGVASGIFQVDPQELEADINANPLHDVVRMWRAPYDGTISINAPVKLLSVPNPSPGADGVKVTIQKNNGIILWQKTIAATDFSTHLPIAVNAVSVNKNDRIYFRVQSIFNGENDLVEWAPEIQYNNQDVTLADANGHKLYRFRSAEEFLLSSPMEIATPIAGKIKISGRFKKPLTTDTVIVEIFRKTSTGQSTVFSRTYPWDIEVNEVIDLNLTVAANESFTFKVTSNSNVDWPALAWKPHMYYTESFDPAVPQVFRDGKPVISYYPVPEYSVFANAVKIVTPWVVTEEIDSLDVTPSIAFPNVGFPDIARFNGNVLFTVKKRDTLLLKENIALTLGQMEEVTYRVGATKDDTLYFEFHTIDERLAESMIGHDVTVTQTDTDSTFAAGLYTKFTEKTDWIFGPLYRQWGQFAYNGNRLRADAPINENELKLSDKLEREYNGGDVSSQEELSNSGAYEPGKENFIMMFAKGAGRTWSGYDEFTYLDSARISSSRMGDDNLLPVEAVPGGSAVLARAVNKISKSTSVSASGGVSGGVANGSANVSSGTSKVLSDFIDMNGDRYPDIVTDKGVQFTKPTGLLNENYDPFTTGNISETTTNSFGASAGGFVKTQPKGGTTNIKDVKSDVGSAKVSGVISVNYGEGTNKGDFSWQDINGDGLPDRVFKNGTVQLNLGYKLAAAEPWNFGGTQESHSQSAGAGLGFSVGAGSESSSISGGVGLSRSDNDVERTLMDLNGDGLLDEVTLNSGVKVKLNTGNGFSSSALTDWAGAAKISESSTTGESANAAFTGCIPLPPIAPVVKLCFNPSGNVGHSMSRDKAQLTDIDGDGFLDYVTSSNDGDLHVSRSAIGRTNLLRSVKRPMGSVFVLNYRMEGNTYEMPNDVWTLASVKIFDGYKGDGIDSMMTTFAYEGGRYDRHERDFYGFKKVITRTHDTGKPERPVYTITTQTYLNDNYYQKGLLVNELMTDGSGRPFTETINNYELKDIVSGVVLPESAKKDAAGTAFPALKETLQKFYEGQTEAAKTTRNTYAYDTRGNVTLFVDYGDATTDDDLTAAISYHDLTDKNITATPHIITVSNGGSVVRKRESVIDPASGDIKAIKQYLSDTEQAVYSMEYDAYGNLSKITKPGNAKGQRLSFQFEYDKEVNTYSTKVSNSYGYSSEATYDVRFGELLLKKDLNNNEIKYELDAVGRVKSITGPYEKNGSNKTIEFEYHPEALIPWALTNHFDPQLPANKMQTVVFADGLARVIQTKKDAALFDGDGKVDKEMMIVSGRIFFDGFGRTVKGFFPTTEVLGKQSEFNSLADNITATETTYDVLNRVVSVKLPDGATTITEYGFGNDRDNNVQFLTKTTDAQGKVSEQFADIRGRITAYKNIAGSDPIWTSFKYNAINEQIEATDNLGFTIYSEYDNLGRRISKRHPDTGTTLYRYDLASNLNETITANLAKEGQSILYTHDFERLVEVTYPQNTENNIRYTYGEAGATDNRAGRIVLQEDASGAQEFFYGPLGEIVKNIRTIVLPKFGEQTYVTEWEYDTWNRLVSMTYADGEKVSYTYNAGGLLRSMSGKKKSTSYAYVNQIGYDKFEQRAFIAYGNGTKTTFNYEPQRRRLSDLTAQTSGKRVFMNNHYTFDKVSNILGIVNDAPLPPANLMGGSSEYTYQYDDLYRLTSAEGSFKSKNDEHTYSLAMAYNSVGGITQKTQTHLRKGQLQRKTSFNYNYTYGEDQPHAAIHIGGKHPQESGQSDDKSYRYDANGNQLGWDDDLTGQRRTIMWDEENRIRSVYDNGAQHHYAYDAAGERVWKAKSVGQRVFVNGEWKAGSGQMGNYTVYVNPYLVLTSGGYTKHYYIEGQRIVSKLGGGWDNNGKGPLKAGGDKVDYAGKSQKVFDGIVKNLKFLGADGQILTAGKSGKVPPGQINGSGNVSEAFRYFFHPDHVGSTSFITDASGEVFQHLEYFAFGETFVEEHSNTDRTPYLFNGKELDEETGLYFYGERYYDPTISIWLSADPLAEMTPGWSPYNYTYNNPVVFTDPDGRIPIETIWDIGNVIYDVGKAVYHHVKGEHDKAKGAWGDAALDAGAMLIPYVPAGVSKLRYADEAVDAVKSLDKLNDAKKLSKADDWEGAIKQGQKAIDDWKAAARQKLDKNLKGTVGDALDAHHTIPLEVLQKNPLMQKAAKEGFDINTFGHLLDKKLHAGPHKEYTQYVENLLTTMQKGNPKLSAKDLVEKKVIPQLNTLIEYAKKNKISINEAAKKKLGL
ncbi:MAG TPA: SpvB/TcaC N-terminal domain-containing protein [Chryseosolibacter sp.]